MQSQVLIFLFCLLTTVRGAAAWSEWNAFKERHNKSYQSADEHRLRFLIFMDNKLRIAEHNKRWARGQESHQLGINQFADLSSREFRERLLHSEQVSQGFGDVYLMPSEVEIEPLPETVDWRTRNAVTAVKSQGDFPTCWSFAATGVVEGRHAIKYGHLQSLSEQNLIDCCLGSEGGYNTWRAVQCIRTLGGIDTEASYPYQGPAGPCSYRPSARAARVFGAVPLPQGNERTMAQALLSGPLAVSINAATIQFYRSGVFRDSSCSRSVNHAVLAVGYGTDPSYGDYWLIKNSWGTGWGESGYIRMARNSDNQCGVASSVFYPIV
ncbi:cathepsin L-like [Drosophila pseudoobscura]|uniref:Cathepsin L-like n=1 Tax=Drosophila pseudoobscura pseudoobscura TaxID=46245 RepID=A0A6I8V0L4_DROPS|nr:cathepsin L [Drosophila pseudoobscura]